tara:strand:+ start:933 stop:1694 length:762 start_codon:yes stop_codon:yes gene_type:complete
MNFKTKILKRIQFNNPVLIEGLPGIGNVGKITLDYLIDSLKAEAFLEIYSNKFPNSVFVNERNLIDLPRITFYYKKFKGKEFILLGGDVQPVDEAGSYEFCDEVLKMFQKLKGKKIITLGGIGLPKIPDHPKVYATGNSKEIMKYFSDRKINKKIFGTVGPIIGVTGLLIGLAKGYKIDAICLLSQTFGHPNYLGIKGARELLKVLDTKFKFGLDFKSLNSEIKDIEKEIKSKTEEITGFTQLNPEQEVSYIG